jgi:hypothetical protein
MPTKAKPETQPETEQPTSHLPISVTVLGESPVSANTFYVSPAGYNWQITIRSTASLEALQGVLELSAALEVFAAEAGFLPKQVGKPAYGLNEMQSIQAGKPVDAPRDTQPIKPASEPEYIPDQQEVAPSVYLPDGAAVNQVNRQVYPSDAQKYHCVKLVILPRPEDKLELDFYGDDRKSPFNDYPTLKFFGLPKDCQTLLRGCLAWNESEFSKAREIINLNWTVYWKLGRERSDGSRFKDVLGAELAK